MPADNEIKKCPECGSSEIIVDKTTGDTICRNCGQVISSHLIDMGPEWREFTPEEKDGRRRVGLPLTPTIVDKGLSTIIGKENIDAYGSKLSPKKRAEVFRLRKWQMRTSMQSSKERNLLIALTEINRLAGQLELPKSVKETAAEIYREIIDKRLVRGRLIEAMAAAAIYAAARINKVLRTLKEVAQASKIDEIDLGSYYRLIRRELDLQIPNISPIDYVSRFVEELKLSTETQKSAIEILKKAEKAGLFAGRDPSGLAASAIYIASIMENERRTQRELANVAHVTEVTVRNRYKELAEKLDLKITV